MPAHEAYEHQEYTNRKVWGFVRRDKVIISHGKGKPGFKLATDGVVAEVKADADRFGFKSRMSIYGAVLMHPCFRWADAVAPAPNGMIAPTRELVGLQPEDRRKPVIDMWRPDGVNRYDIRFLHENAKKLARAVKKIVLLEDISTTGRTVYEQAKILREVNPELEIHSISWMNRAQPRAEYQRGPEAVTYHTLCVPPVQPMPTGWDEFVAAYDFEPTIVPANYS